MKREKLLEIRDLVLSFHTQGRKVQAIRGVNLDLYKGETLAIVGESGSGKSVLTRSIIGLLPKRNTQLNTGSIIYQNEDIARFSEKKFEKIRGKEIAMIFQDPMTSLNPTMTVAHQIMEPLVKKQKLSRKQAREETISLLQRVGIAHAEERANQYPHQFSGGMRQRVVIAIALACHPKILIADEPTTALDVTVQAQIIDLLKDIQKKSGMTIIFITHDLGVVARIADRVAVMYAGRIVEIGTTNEIFYQSRHPYTWGLLCATPDLETSGDSLYTIPGSPPDLANPPEGDAFALRNTFAMRIDYYKHPPMFQVSDTHYVASWLLHPDAPDVTPPDEIIRRRKRLAEYLNASGGEET